MMTLFSFTHIMMVLATIFVISLLMFIVSKLSRLGQDILIYTAVFVCMGGIIFLHLTRYGTTFNLHNLLRQMLQVCNFNLILLPLSLIKKNELARQYLLFFSMFAAASTFVTYPSDVQNSMWYSPVTLTFWLNHSLIVAVPLMMVASRRLKPKKEYLFKVTLCLVGYFMFAHLGNLVLNTINFGSANYNFSYTMSDGGIMVLKPLWDLIPVPFVYLLPLLPAICLLFYLFTLMFQKYEVREF